MLGFLFKLVVLAAFSLPKLTDIGSVSGSLKSLDMAGIGRRLSQSLDDLVSHDSHSPVVLGVQITDTSLDTVVNLIRNLPPDQFNQIKSFVCQSATPAAK